MISRSYFDTCADPNAGWHASAYEVYQQAILGIGIVLTVVDTALQLKFPQCNEASLVCESYRREAAGFVP